MRFLLLSFIFPIALSAQSFDAAAEPTDQNMLQRSHFKAGILVQRDQKSSAPYTLIAADIVPAYQRRHLISGVFGFSPIARLPGLRTQLRIGYSDTEFNGTYLDIGDNRFGPGFRETVHYGHLQLAGGIRIEASADAGFSPYLAGHYLLAVPLHLNYSSFRESPDLNIPIASSVEGGGRLSPGWEISSGLRINISQHFLIDLGVYYTENDILMNWAELTQRDFRHKTIFRTQTFGLMFSCGYRW